MCGIPPCVHSSQTELMALPENTPDILHVVCNNKRGVLNLRTQRVVHNDLDMSVTAFEKVCGRGDAKKWKTSLW